MKFCKAYNFASILIIHFYRNEYYMLCYVQKREAFITLKLTPSGAPLHHLAYQILVYQLVFCYIDIGIIIADIKSIDR